MARLLPTGQVTFLFTDVEGSTRLYRALGDRYVDLLERHNALLRRAWEAYGGAEVKTDGDAFFVAFADAPSAVAACRAAQRHLCTEAWPADGTFRVRMGLHTGLAAPRDGDYVALAVHEAARIAALAHGGQVVLSPTTTALLADVPDVELRDLGEWRVRDFDGPVRVHQLVIGGIPDDFPPLRARPARHHNMRTTPNSFIGREDEMRGIAELLDEAPLVTIVGPGGIGKTRVATELGVLSAQHWPDGVWFVDLAPTSDRAGIVGAVSDAIGVHGDWDDLVEALEARRLLLIVDNCEQVLADCAAVVAQLQERCSGVTVLATSREPLDLAAERVWRLPPLPITDAATRLFTDRARAVAPRAELDSDLVAEICHGLDGWPIAIELAAARVSALTLADIRRGLSDPMQLLGSRGRRHDQRQRTMTALLDWSYDLLPPDEQGAFRRLGMFVGSFDLRAAAVAVGQGDAGSVDATELVWSLVDKSLVLPEFGEGETRYRLMETIRAYAATRLAAAGETATTAAELGRWFASGWDEARLRDPAAVGELDPDISTFRSLARTLGEHDVDTAQLLLWILLKWYWARGRHGQAVDELSPLVDEAGQDGPLSIDLLGELAQACQTCNRIDLAWARITEAERLIQEGHRPHFGRGVLDVARAMVLLRGGDPRAGHAAAMAAAAGAAPHERLRLLNVAGMAAAEFGDPEQALDVFLECLQACLALDWPGAEAVVLGGVAEIECRMGRTHEAAGHYRRSLRLSLELGDEGQVAMSLLGAARVASQRGLWPAAVQLEVAGEDMLAATGERLMPSDMAISEQLRSDATDQLGPEVEMLERDVRSWDVRRTLDSAAALLDAIAPDDVVTARRDRAT